MSNPSRFRGLLFFSLLIIGVAALFVGEARAQGIMIPRERDEIRRPPHPIPRPRPIPPVLAIKSVKITTTIKNQVAETHIEQVFRNDTPYVLEGTYCFPIPESATFVEFAIWDGQRRLAGEVVERNKARQIYNDIVRTMRDPGLLEYVGKDLFQASVFPIPGNSDKKIELRYSQVLEAQGGTVRYRYPLGSGQRALNAPPQSVVGTVEIESSAALKAIYSPSHGIDVKRDGEKKARMSFEVTGAKATEDFQLYYGLGDKDFGMSLVTHREPGKDGYFMLIVAPKTNLDESERLPKDVVFVFDTSGSMSGEKIDKARNALKFGLESLGPNDRFNVIRFSGEEHLFDTGLIAASRDNIKRATTFVENFRAEGGTNIHDAMMAGLKQFTERNGDRPRMVVFLTDGLPTVGTTDAKAIETATAKANDFGARIFTFGVGYDVNTKLLDAIARGNRAVSDYIEPNEDLEAKVSTFFGRVNYPVLSDIKLDFGGVDTELVYPRTLPDLFRGGQLVLVGRYKGDDRAAVLRLRGNAVGRERTFIYEGQTFRRVEHDNTFLPKLWATRRVGALLEQIRLNGENKELVDEIVSLGTKHGIVTPYTSFLATEGQPMADDGVRRPMPREPRQRDGAGIGGAPGRGVGSGRANTSAAPSMKAESGESAVRASKDEKKLSDADKVGTEQTATLKTVGTKTFELRDGVWTDLQIDQAKKLPSREVKFGSEEYFALVTKMPKLADYFALGTRVVVVLDDVVYRVTE